MSELPVSRYGFPPNGMGIPGHKRKKEGKKIKGGKEEEFKPHSHRSN
jgi:hypothetical protein